MATIDTLSVAVTADTSDFTKAITDADKLAKSFGDTMTSSFSSAVVRGKSLTETISSLGLRLSSVALNAALKPVSESLTSGFEGLFKGLGTLGSSLFAGTGSVGAPLNILPFASGGVVSTPSYFPMGQGGMGLMGEAGSEAIMPLSRGSDGRLGVAMHGGGNSSPPVVINISTPDAASFRRSQADISAALARAVARGQKAL